MSQPVKFEVVKNDDKEHDGLEKLLDAIGFENHCCGCDNHRYSTDKNFTAIIEFK